MLRTRFRRCTETLKSSFRAKHSGNRICQEMQLQYLKLIKGHSLSLYELPSCVIPYTALARALGLMYQLNCYNIATDLQRSRCARLKNTVYVQSKRRQLYEVILYWFMSFDYTYKCIVDFRPCMIFVWSLLYWMPSHEILHLTEILAPYARQDGAMVTPGELLLKDCESGPCPQLRVIPGAKGLVMKASMLLDLIIRIYLL